MMLLCFFSNNCQKVVSYAGWNCMIFKFSEMHICTMLCIISFMITKRMSHWLSLWMRQQSNVDGIWISYLSFTGQMPMTTESFAQEKTSNYVNLYRIPYAAVIVLFSIKLVFYIKLSQFIYQHARLWI